MIEQKFVDLYARGKKVNLLIAERSVVLTYLLRILEDAGLSSIALKGGTCLRKVYFKDMARFSLDLDMVYLVKAEPSEAILEVAEIIEGTHYGITFSLSDVYVNIDNNAGGALFNYKHDWNEAFFTLDLSLRSLPLLAVVKKPLIVESYFRHLSVLKCWESRTVFEPVSFMERIEKSQYEMAELQQVVFQTKRVRLQDLIKTLKQE